MDVVIDKAQMGEENEAEIARWLIENGGTVRAGQILVEIETGKAHVEIEAAASGRVQILVQAGQVIEPNTVIARIL
jgi:2-oxoglutarate dehydrogenase E2 component (dihydrolipoamide succinyltransferase)